MEATIVRGERTQHEYVRFGNPSQDRLNERLALLEQAEDALVFSSGMAAITNAVLSVVRRGEEVIASATLYGQTLNFLRKSLPREYGIDTKFITIPELYHLIHRSPDLTLQHLLL